MHLLQVFIRTTLRLIGRLSLTNWRLKHTWLTQPHARSADPQRRNDWSAVRVRFWGSLHCAVWALDLQAADKALRSTSGFCSPMRAAQIHSAARVGVLPGET